MFSYKSSPIQYYLPSLSRKRYPLSRPIRHFPGNVYKPAPFHRIKFFHGIFGFFASALIAEGGESGGHVGELTTMVLVPQVCDATSLPVIAAGGIADGRGVAAAFLLGACGVQMGTRFLSAEECSIHPVYKERILKANDLCTMVTGKRLGHPVRSLRTNFARNYSKAEYGGMDDEALEALGSGALRKAVVEGDLEHGCFLSGQIAAMVHEVQPAADIVRDVIEGAEPVLKGATKWVR